MVVTVDTPAATSTRGDEQRPVSTQRRAMGEASPSRSMLVLRRWRSVLAVTLLTLAIAHIAARVDSDKLEWIAFLPNWAFLALSVALAALLTHLSWRRLTAAFGLRHSHTYPGMWIGVAVGLAAELYFLGSGTSTEGTKLSSEAQYNFLIAAKVVSGLPVTALVCSVLFFLRPRRQQPTSAWNEDPKPLADQDLSTWYLNDDPICSPDEDRFGHRAVAQRMSKRLSMSDAPAQAVVGRLGSGKTTIRELVKCYLHENSTSLSVELVTVELWPYETPRAAVEGILDVLVDALSRDVSISQLSGIPSRYGEVIARIAGVSKWIPSAIEGKVPPPSTLLREFDDVATAIGKRYALWVEDLERFAAAGHPDSPGEAGELERLAPFARSCMALTACVRLLLSQRLPIYSAGSTSRKLLDTWRLYQSWACAHRDESFPESAINGSAIAR